MLKQIFLKINSLLKKILPISAIKKISFFRNVNDAITSKFKSEFVEVDGHQMYLDKGDVLNLSINRIHEPFETDLIKREIKEGDVVVDVGANIGYYTLIIARIVGDKGKVFAFEPDPENFQLLKKNVEINGYKNVVLEQKAVSDKSEQIKLFVSKDNPADHRIYDTQDGREAIALEAISLNDYFKDADIEINFIKMDIQGAEGKAIKGMSSILKSNNNVKMISEFWPHGLKKFDIDPKGYLDYLDEHGFTLYNVDENKKRMESISIDEFWKSCNDRFHDNYNLFCVKKSEIMYTYK